MSRLALSFSNTLSLGRRKKKSTSPTTRPDSNTAKWAKSGEGGAGGSGQRTVVIDYRKDVRDGNVYFQVEGAIAGGRAEWVDARVAIAMWPRAVLDYYMSGLVFGGPEEEEAPDDDGGGWWRSTEAVRGLREAASEESELQLIQKLLQVRKEGSLRRRSSFRKKFCPIPVNRLVSRDPGVGCRPAA